MKYFIAGALIGIIVSTIAFLIEEAIAKKKPPDTLGELVITVSPDTDDVYMTLGIENEEKLMDSETATFKVVIQSVSFAQEKPPL